VSLPTPHIRTSLGRNRGNSFYRSVSEGGDKSLCGDEVTAYDVPYAHVRRVGTKRINLTREQGDFPPLCARCAHIFNAEEGR